MFPQYVPAPHPPHTYSIINYNQNNSVSCKCLERLEQYSILVTQTHTLNIYILLCVFVLPEPYIYIYMVFMQFVAPCYDETTYLKYNPYMFL